MIQAQKTGNIINKLTCISFLKLILDLTVDSQSLCSSQLILIVNNGATLFQAKNGVLLLLD
jgi:hypothetical protein